jgi:hypothetical protein
LTNIAETDVQHAQSILQWLAFSERPLTLAEVAEAAVLRPGDDPTDPDDRFFDPSHVLQICRSLISLSREKLDICGVRTESDVVRFAHFSVQEYLTSDRSASFSISATSAHSYIGESCLSCLLQLDVLGLQLLEQELDYNPLLSYSAEHWFRHVKKVEGEADTVNSVLDRSYKLFSENSTRCFLKWLRVYDPVSDRRRSNWLRHHIRRIRIDWPLFYTSLLGLHDTTQMLLKSSNSLNPADWYNRALRVASGCGHYNIVRCLLSHGVNPLGALAWASRTGQDEVVQLFLERGVDVNKEPGVEFEDPLQEAIARGYIRIAMLLIERVSNLNKIARTCGSTLAIAANTGNEQVVQKLL